MTKRNQPERQERIAFMEWVRLNPTIKKYLIAVEGGGYRHHIEAANLKRCGLVAGPLDYLFMLPCGKYHGMWIEFKVKPNKLSSAQIQFIKTVEEVGYYCVVAWNWAEAAKEIESYIKLGARHK